MDVVATGKERGEEVVVVDEEEEGEGEGEGDMNGPCLLCFVLLGA